MVVDLAQKIAVDIFEGYLYRRYTIEPEKMSHLHVYTSSPA